MRNRAETAGVLPAMPKVVRLVLALAVALAVSGGSVRSTFACSCVPTTPEEAVARAEVAFVGTVTGAGGADLLPGPAGPAPVGDVAFEFAVEGVAKGDVPQPATVSGGMDMGTCGMSFELGSRWLIVATAHNGVLATDLCAGNVELATNQPPPVPVETAPQPASPDAGFALPGPVLLTGAAVGAIALASYLAFRRRPEH
jgi:hypothetical protein